MQDKTTNDLSQELMSQSNIGDYIRENQGFFTEQDVTDRLTELYKKRSIPKAALARQAGMSEVYLHQIFSGRRNPSRDRLICLCVGMEVTLEEIQDLLKQVGHAPLYPKIRRDAIISHGIFHGENLHEINDALFAEGEKTLF